MSSNMNVRISFLHNTESEWAALDPVPKPGELIIYDADEEINYPRVKIGNGIDKLSSLPFFIDSRVDYILRNDRIIDGGNVVGRED